MGSPKALLPHPNGGTFIEYITKVAASVSEHVLLLGSSGKLPSSLDGIPRLPDTRPNAGPLAGLCALLEHAGDGWTLLLACDLPFVTKGTLERLVSCATADVDAVAFQQRRTPAVYHVCCALYHARVLPEAQRELFHGRGRPQALLGCVRLAALQPSEQEERQLMNVNTQAEFDVMLSAGGSNTAGETSQG